MVRQCDPERLAHVCLLSSVGVTRTDKARARARASARSLLSPSSSRSSPARLSLRARTFARRARLPLTRRAARAGAKLPFLARNLGGALDRKRALEGELQLRSLKQGFDYTVG